MAEKILVTYVTRSGSTAEVAGAIAEILRYAGAQVDLLPLKQVGSLDGYRAVVLGSAVRIGGWLPEAVRFVEKHQDALRQRQTAFFAVHLMNMGSDQASQAARQAYLDPVRRLVKPSHEAFFAGIGDWKKVSFLDGLIGKAVKAPTGDFRDWDAIRAWAAELAQHGFAAEAAQPAEPACAVEAA